MVKLKKGVCEKRNMKYEMEVTSSLIFIVRRVSSSGPLTASQTLSTRAVEARKRAAWIMQMVISASSVTSE